MNIFRILRDYLLSKPIGHEFTRTEMLALSNEEDKRESAIDKYKAKFIVIGILERIGVGKYKIVKHPEINLTLRQLRTRAFVIKNPLDINNNL